MSKADMTANLVLKVHVLQLEEMIKSPIGDRGTEDVILESKYSGSGKWILYIYSCNVQIKIIKPRVFSDTTERPKCSNLRVVEVFPR